jgi:hypothetical protein
MKAHFGVVPDLCRLRNYSQGLGLRFKVKNGTGNFFRKFNFIVQYPLLEDD